MSRSAMPRSRSTWWSTSRPSRAAGRADAAAGKPLLEASAARSRRRTIFNAEYRVAPRSAAAVRERRRRAQTDVRARPRCQTQILLDDRRPLLVLAFGEPHRTLLAADEGGLGQCPRVPYSLAVAQHRDQVIPALVPGHYHREPMRTA